MHTTGCPLALAASVDERRIAARSPRVTLHDALQLPDAFLPTHNMDVQKRQGMMHFPGD